MCLRPCPPTTRSPATLIERQSCERTPAWPSGGRLRPPAHRCVQSRWVGTPQCIEMEPMGHSDPKLTARALVDATAVPTAEATAQPPRAVPQPAGDDTRRREQRASPTKGVARHRLALLGREPAASVLAQTNEEADSQSLESASVAGGPKTQKVEPGGFEPPCRNSQPVASTCVVTRLISTLAGGG